MSADPDDFLRQSIDSSDVPVESDLLGTVLAVQANYYWVRLHRLNAPESLSPEPINLLCTRRSRLKKIGQRVIVGDRVRVEEPDWAGGRGAIAEVLPREAEIDRPPIANVNQILLVFALAAPPIEPYQLSRFLVKAEATDLDVCLCLSKSDLASQEEQQHWDRRLHEWGYHPVFISVPQGLGLTKLLEQLSQRITVVSGPSGVGKSSLINRLIPDVELRVGAVSGKLEKGRHTTRHVELFELPGGGLLADTPGFNQPDLDVAPEQLATCFPEARSRLAAAQCQFSDCLHRDEPGCVVRGEWERYPDYLEFLADAIDRQTALNQQSTPDAVLKRKTGGKGEAQYEPRLEAKKYRRESRRTQQQSLQKLRQDIDRLMDSEED